MFYVVRREPAGNDVRSLRTDLKKHIDAMQISLEKTQGDMGARQERLERQVDDMMVEIKQISEEIRKLTRRTPEDSPKVAQREVETIDLISTS